VANFIQQNFIAFIFSQRYIKARFSFSLASVVFDLLDIFVIFHQIKAVKHIRDPCCHLLAEAGSLFILKVTVLHHFLTLNTSLSAYPLVLQVQNQ
jgi:hypothetical protein